MCFSVTSGFSVGTVLLGLSTLMLMLASCWRVPSVIIPLLFAIQKLSEVVIWLNFRYKVAGKSTAQWACGNWRGYVENGNCF